MCTGYNLNYSIHMITTKSREIVPPRFVITIVDSCGQVATIVSQTTQSPNALRSNNGCHLLLNYSIIVT